MTKKPARCSHHRTGRPRKKGADMAGSTIPPRRLLTARDIERGWHRDRRTVLAYARAGLLDEAPRPPRGSGSRRVYYTLESVQAASGMEVPR